MVPETTVESSGANTPYRSIFSRRHCERPTPLLFTKPIIIITPDPNATLQTPVTAEGACGALGNETRIQILSALGAADGPLSFSALREAVGVADFGGFNYHLDTLEGAFVDKTVEGYALTHAGWRVVEAIFSGVLTEDPGIERIHVDRL